MGAYRYCKSCNNGLMKPTAREDLIDKEQICPACGNENLPDQTMAAWIEDVDQRLREIEALFLDEEDR